VWWAKNVARVGEMRNLYNILVGKLEGQRPLGRHRRRWKDSIKMVKVKVKLPCAFFNRAPLHEGVLREWIYSSTHSLTSALDGGE
jgi:hypothetical protein